MSAATILTAHLEAAGFTVRPMASVMRPAERWFEQTAVRVVVNDGDSHALYVFTDAQMAVLAWSVVFSHDCPVFVIIAAIECAVGATA